MESDKESQKPLLPKDVFRNRFTWTCYVLCNDGMCWVIVGFWTIVGLVMIRMITDKFVKIWVAVNVVLCCPLLILNTIVFWLHHLERKCSSELARQVLELNPGTDIEKWNFISSISNGRLYRDGKAKTPYLFFDGQDAQHSFRRDVLKLHLDGKFDGTISPGEIESARNYQKSVHKEFEFESKETLPDFPPESDLIKRQRENRFLSYFHFSRIIWQFNAIIFLISMLGLGGFSDPEIFVPFFFLFILHQCTCISCRHIPPCICGVMNVGDATKFLARITKIKPGNNLDKWDEIARQMNADLVDEESSKSDLRFRDAKHCLEFYETYFQPISIGKNHWYEEYYELKGIVKVTQLYVG